MPFSRGGVVASGAERFVLVFFSVFALVVIALVYATWHFVKMQAGIPSKVPGADHRRIAYSPSLFNSLLELRYSVKFLTSVATHFRKKFRAASLSSSTRSFMPT